MPDATRKPRQPDGKKRRERKPARPAKAGPEAAGPDPLARALEENRQLADQVKRLARLESQLQGALEKMEAQCRLYAQFCEAGRKLNSTLDPKGVIPVVTQFMLNETNFQLCVVLSRANGDDVFLPVGLDGYYEDAELQALQRRTVAAGDPVVRRLTGATSPLLCEPGGADRELREFGAQFGMDEYVLFPLYGQAGALAWLLVAGNRADRAECYSRVQAGSPMLVGLEGFVAQVGAALRNVRLYTELQRQRDGLEARVAERTRELEGAEQAAKESALQLRAILENTVDIIYTTDASGVITYISPTIGMWGYTPTEIIGRSIVELVHPDDQAKMAHEFGETMNTGRTFPSYFRVFTKDRREIHVEEYGKRIAGPAGTAGVTGVIRDVTPRREMEEALRQSEERFRTLVSNLPVGLYRNTAGPQGRFIQANPATARIFGYGSAEEIMKVAVVDLYQDPDDRTAFIDEILRHGAVRDYPLALKKKDGTAFWAACTATAHFNAKGELEWLDGTLEDITERKRMEEEIRDSQRRLSDILQFLPDATFVVDNEGRVTAWNRAMERLTGVPARDMVGKGNDEYTIPFYGERRAVLIDLVRTPDDAVLQRYSAVRRDGEVLFAEGYAQYLKAGGWFEAAAAPLRDADGHLVGAIETYRDITERKRMESQLKESQRRLEDIIAFLPDATFAIDVEGRVTAWNRAAEIMTGIKAPDILGKGNYEYAVPFYGSRRPILIDLVMRPPDEAMEEYTHLHRHGDTLSGQGHITNIGGGDTYFVGSAVALRDSSGRIVGAIETVRDVTERKRFEDELARTRDAAEAANRAKSAFLAMMSHEIRTPMNAIIGMSGLLIDSPLTPQQMELTTAIRNSGEVLLTVINDILDFSKIEAGRLELEIRPMDIRQCVESALDLLAYRARDKKLELGCMIEPDTPVAVLGDGTRLNQILINLVGNAIKFTEKGEVMVRVDSRRLEEAAAAGEGRYEIHFAIRDTGIGIPADRIGPLFQAFSQADSATSRRYGGTGLGLAISKRLAELMDGRIWAESEVGKGSTFHFTLVAAATAASTAGGQVAQQAVLDGKRILIVDDNPTNRQTVYHQVTSWGMQPLMAESAEDALACLRRGDPADVVLTDLCMPLIDGVELTRTLQDELGRSAVPVVLMSSSSEALAPAHAERFKAVLLKPVRASRLYDALVQVFGAGGAAVEERTSVGERSPFDPEMGRTHPLRILLAEDNPTNQMLAVAMLARMGYRAAIAGDGREAVEAVTRQVYDVVLMDVQMPGMDGMEATREIRRSLPAQRQPRIIAMTADAMVEDRDACLASGMDDYISKPVLVERLVAALRKSKSVGSAQAAAPASVAGGPAAAAGSNATPVIDPAALERLRETLGQQADALLPVLLKSFESDGARLFQAARTALDARRAVELRRAAHTLKSTSATFGAMELSATAREIEGLAKINVFDGVPALMERAEREFAAAQESLARLKP